MPPERKADNRVDHQVGDEVGFEDGVPPADEFLTRNPFAMVGRNHKAEHVVLDAEIGASIEAARKAALVAAANEKK